MVDLGELRSGEFGELVLEEGVDVTVVFHVAGGEDRSLIGGSTERGISLESSTEGWKTYPKIAGTLMNFPASNCL